MKTTPRSKIARTAHVSSTSGRKMLSELANKKRNRKNAMLSSDSENENHHEPVNKKLKAEFEEKHQLETPKRNVSQSLREKRITKKESGAKIETSNESNNDVKLEPNETKDILLQNVGLSEYEIQIQKNIEARAKFMNSLEIFAAKENLLELSPKVTPKPAKSEKRGIARERNTPPQPQERRRSLRQQNLAPDGINLVLPSEKDVALAGSYIDDVETPRPNPGPAPLMDYYEKSHKEECEECLSDISKISKTAGKMSVWGGSLTSVLDTLKMMKINEDLVAKVTPQRTFSIQIHPSEEKLLLLLGAKWGQLGMWDIERKDSTDGAYYFNVHSKPINCLTIDRSKPENVYTTSYDGSVRRTNLSSGIVEEVFSNSTPGEHVPRWLSCHAHQDENFLLIGNSEGNVLHHDLRGVSGTSKLPVHDKNIKVVTVHPTQNNYFATSSQSMVRLWDLRNHKKHKPISEVKHGKAVSGLEFSPVTGTTLVSTSSDNYLRIISCDLMNLKVLKNIPHNNHTGRWLTTFRARFFPNREDLIIVGSLHSERRIEVLDVNGRIQHNLMGESFTSINSITAVHPTLPVIAGANSSGKAFVFKSGI